MAAYPKMIVFDLDNTLWTPELYQLRRKIPRNAQPKAGKDVRLFPGASKVLEMIRDRTTLPESCRFAVASRTQSGEWAHYLLDQFKIRELMDHVEIYPGSKLQHFCRLKEESGVSYSEMLFFDDARGGKYGNCVPVSELGVLAVHCPNGLETFSVFEHGLDQFRKWDKTGGTIVEGDGSMSLPTCSSERQEGQIKMISESKGYGFIRFAGGRDIFFHFRNLPTGIAVSKGDSVSFVVEIDEKNGKTFATDIEIKGSVSSFKKQTVTLKTFSMNQPFAALLANGYKTIETRNGTMFASYPEGTKFLLHVGRRTYPDENKHISVMKSGGLGDEEIAKLKSLPKGFSRGMVIAICEIGKTVETSVAERSNPVFERKVAAFGSDSGRMATEIRKAAYLKKPIRLQGKGGVWDAEVEADVIPDGWDITAAQRIPRPTGKDKPMYTISG